MDTNRIGRFIVLSMVLAMLIVGTYVAYRFVTWEPAEYRQYYDHRSGISE
jgi:hypothetical protein